MPLETRLLISIASLAVTLMIARLVRRKRLDEKYAFLWLASGVVMTATPLLYKRVDALSRMLGFYYPPAFVFLAAFLGLCLISLQFSVVISRLSKQNRALAQRIAILQQRVEQLETTGSGDTAPPGHQ